MPRRQALKVITTAAMLAGSVPVLDGAEGGAALGFPNGLYPAHRQIRRVFYDAGFTTHGYTTWNSNGNPIVARVREILTAEYDRYAAIRSGDGDIGERPQLSLDHFKALKAELAKYGALKSDAKDWQEGTPGFHAAFARLMSVDLARFMESQGVALRMAHVHIATAGRSTLAPGFYPHFAPMFFLVDRVDLPKVNEAIGNQQRQILVIEARLGGAGVARNVDFAHGSYDSGSRGAYEDLSRDYGHLFNGTFVLRTDYLRFFEKELESFGRTPGAEDVNNHHASEISENALRNLARETAAKIFAVFTRGKERDLDTAMNEVRRMIIAHLRQNLRTVLSDRPNTRVVAELEQWQPYPLEDRWQFHADRFQADLLMQLEGRLQAFEEVPVMFLLDMLLRTRPWQAGDQIREGSIVRGTQTQADREIFNAFGEILLPKARMPAQIIAALEPLAEPATARTISNEVRKKIALEARRENLGTKYQEMDPLKESDPGRK